MADEFWRHNGLFCDGGCCGHNPSPIGVTWAWVLVQDDQIVREDSGIIRTCAVCPTVSNNVAEYAAAVQALESLPAGWNGYLCSDSQVTLGRLFQGWQLKGISNAWAARATAALARLGHVEPVLLQGHPTKADLARGIGAKRNLPVSKWNALCDRRCQERAASVMAGQ